MLSVTRHSTRSESGVSAGAWAGALGPVEYRRRTEAEACYSATAAWMACPLLSKTSGNALTKVLYARRRKPT